MRKAISAALFIGGLILLWFGYQEYHSFQSEVHNFFTGTPTDRAMWMLIGGAAISVAGLVGLLRK